RLTLQRLSELLFQLRSGCALATHARSRLRSGRTKLATTRSAFRALARQGHPRGRSIGSGYPGNRHSKIYHGRAGGVCAILGGCMPRARTGSSARTHLWAGGQEYAGDLIAFVGIGVLPVGPIAVTCKITSPSFAHA